VALTAQPGFGARLKDHRQRLGLSQADLAAAGVSSSYVSLLENGHRQPTPDVARLLAERLGVDVEVLLHGVGADDALKARLDLAFARLCLGQGDHAQAARTLTSLLDGGRLSPDPRAVFDARLLLATAQERLGMLEAAVRLLEALRGEAQASPEALPWLPVVTALSRCYREAGDLRRAVDVAERAADRCDELGLHGLEGHAEVVATLALAHFDRGDMLRAATLLDRLIETTAGSDRQSQAAAHWNAALVASGRGHHGDALRLGEKAAALIAEGSDERAAARLKSTRAWILLNQEPPRPEAARDLLHAALPTLTQHDSAGAVASAEVELSRAELMLGDPARARAHALAALNRLGYDTPIETARAHTALGEALAADGDRAGAQERLHAAAALLSDVGADREAAALWRQIGDAHGRLGEPERAMAAYRNAMDAAGLRARSVPALDVRQTVQ